jgi:hypothetical protein
MNEWYNKSIKGISKSETICVRHCTEDGKIKWIITVDRYKNYKLYKYENDTAIYTKNKADNPIDLEDYV